MTSPVPDEAWAEYARASRDALASLGYGITPRCLPDEIAPCGASYAQHTTAHLATIKAVCDHQLVHLGQPFIAMHGEIYLDKRLELESDHGCQGVPDA
jgi:hypothetical protein